MEVINKIKIDLLKPGVKPMINAMQADENSRVLEITLNANGSAWEIPDGVSFSMAYKKPDGTRGLYDTMPDGTSASSADGNVLSIRLAPQMLTAPGTVTASVVISSGDQRISTFPIIVNVIQNPAVGAVGSEDYFYSSVIGNLDDLKTTNKSSLVAAINEIFRTGGSGSNSGQNPTGGGMSATASALLINILRNAMYTADQSANITALEAALATGGGSGENSGGDSGGGETTETTYTIVNVLTNVTNSNSTAKVSEGASYIGKLTAADGFNMSTVTVTMGGVNVTADVYADGTITIESVTGNVIITASAVEDSATAPAFELASPLVLGDTTDPRINDTANNYIVTGETLNDDEDWTVCIDFTSLAGATAPDKPIVRNGNRQFGISYDAADWVVTMHGTYVVPKMLNDRVNGLLGGKNFVEVITYNSASKTVNGYGSKENTHTFSNISTASEGQAFINCSNAVGTINRFALYKRVLSADEITEWIGG